MSITIEIVNNDTIDLYVVVRDLNVVLFPIILARQLAKNGGKATPQPPVTADAGGAGEIEWVAQDSSGATVVTNTSSKVHDGDIVRISRPG